MCVYTYIYIYIYIYISPFSQCCEIDAGVCGKKRSFYASLGHATQRLSHGKFGLTNISIYIYIYTYQIGEMPLGRVRPQPGVRPAGACGRPGGMYTYTCMYVYVCVCMYVYIYIYNILPIWCLCVYAYVTCSYIGFAILCCTLLYYTTLHYTIAPQERAGGREACDEAISPRLSRVMTIYWRSSLILMITIISIVFITITITIISSSSIIIIIIILHLRGRRVHATSNMTHAPTMVKALTKLDNEANTKAVSPRLSRVVARPPHRAPASLMARLIVYIYIYV